MKSFFQGVLRGLGFAVVAVILPLVLTVVLVGRLMSGGEGPLSDYNPKTDRAVAVVELAGEISIVDKFRESLKKAVNDKKIKAIALRINSPGGGTGASEELYHLIRDADQKKPVVCSLGSVAASGGLYAAQGCRKIVTLRGTMTGSIGVVVMLPVVREVMDRFGVKMNVIKSGEYKDVGSPFRAMNDQDEKLLTRLIDQTYEQFIDVISQSRGIPKDELRKFADGRIILGEEALQLKLVDEIGGTDRAAKIALEATGDLGEPEVLYPREKSGIERLLASEAFSFIREISASKHVRVLYRGFL